MTKANTTKIENAPAIAVIGMAGRFPKAENIEKFWLNLKQGQDCITHFTKEELREEGISNDIIENSRYVKARGILQGIDLFDANFFGLTPAEAALMDPQQRLFLELCWEALEISGYSSLKECSIGVYAGMSDSSYLNHNILNNEEITKSNSSYQINIATSNHFLATKVSYLLNLTGPSIAVNSACSTSLVAIIEACSSLLNYECDLALAGGIAIRVPQIRGYLYQEGGIYSVDGRCRVFDSKSSGTVSSNGGGVVVLKRLDEALQAGDSVDAVIRSFAINNDGSTKIGYSAPSIIEQARCIATALSAISPELISYVEAHGTGTKLGDPVEIAALNKAFRHYTTKKNYCAIGSVKTNIGHTDVAAGVAGFIKTALALKHKTIPASLYFNEANPEINFTDSPFYVNGSTKAWDGEFPRRAGVSSFGIGGTNAHLILEEAPLPSPQKILQDRFIIPISAKSEAALQQQQSNLLDYLKQNQIDKTILANLAYTLQVGRETFNLRKVFLCKDAEELISLLQSGKCQVIKESAYSLAEKWLIDGQADWSLISKGLALRRIPLPTYPFAKKSYWISPSLKRDTQSTGPFVYQPYWKLTSLINHAPSSSINWLIFTDKLGIGEKIVSHLQNLRKNAIQIKVGESFRRLSSFCFEINPSIKDNYQELLNILKEEQQFPDSILYCWGLTDGNKIAANISINYRQLNDFIALTYLAQIFFVNSANNQLQLYIITNYLARLLTEDKIYPEQSLLLSIAAVVPQEFSVASTMIDTGCITEKSIDDKLITSLVDECMKKPEKLLVAYRHNLRFIQQFEGYELSEHTSKIHLKKGGVYLLTGGLGKIGIKLAYYLASHYEAHLILTTRTTIPYMQILQQHEYDLPHLTSFPLIAQLLNIKKCASSLYIARADVANYDHMSEVFNYVTKTHKKLDGLFHLAAVLDDLTRVFIKEITTEQLQSQWLAKIAGVNVLAQLVDEEEIDFCLLFSSIATVLGGVGLCTYAAANNYLNYFAESKFSPNERIKWFSVSWDAWRHGLPEMNRVDGKRDALTFQQGMSIIEDYFNSMDTPNLFVSLKNINNRISKSINHSVIGYRSIHGSSSHLQAIEKAPVKETMQQLFRESLGEPNINPNVGFYDLGGDSLAAITLLELIEEKFSTPISLTNFLENQSINKLVKFINKQKLNNSSFIVNLKPKVLATKALFFIHPIGGTAFCYFNLVNFFSDYSCYALQDPGLTSDQFNFESLEEMASFYLQEIKRKQPQGPYLLGGYSFGATLAFEIARQLLLCNEQVEKIFIIDGWAVFSPELRDKNRFSLAMQRTLAELAERMPRLLKKRNELLEFLWKRMQLLLTYKPTPLPLNLILFKAQDILPEYQSINSMDNHWSLLTTKSVIAYQITGDHSNILELPGAKEIGKIINDLLV